MMLERGGDVQQREHRKRVRQSLVRVVQASYAARFGATKSGSVTRPNQLTGKLRADDISQPSSGDDEQQRVQQEMRDVRRESAASAASPAAAAGTGVEQRQTSRSSARARIVMPTDLCCGERRRSWRRPAANASALFASTNCVTISTTMAQ